MFDASLAGSPRPLQQSDEYAAALSALGTPPLRLGDGTVVLTRRFGPVTLGMIPRAGPGALAALRTLPGWARRPVILAPDRPCDGPGLPLISPATVTTLDLTVGATALRAGLKAKWRNRLRRAEDSDLRIGRRDLPDRVDQWLLRAEQRMQARRGYRAWPAALTLAYARANPGKAVLFTATYKGTPIAAMLFLRHGRRASYHIGQTSGEGRARHAHTALMWRAMEWLAAQGVRQLDLGTIDTEAAPGLAHFKLGTGARARPLGGTWLDAPLLRPLTPLARLDRALMQA